MDSRFWKITANILVITLLHYILSKDFFTKMVIYFQDLEMPSYNPPNTDQQKREQIRQAMKNAWDAYSKYAWGYDFLNPITLQGENLHGLGYTIIDSLDSLLLMGLNDEYKSAVNWIENSFNYSEQTSFFETVIRAVGGLLTAYEQTYDPLLLDTAKKIADRISFAFHPDNALPRVLVNMFTGELYDHSWANMSTLLSDAGSCQLEFLALSYHTGNYKYFDTAMEARANLISLGPVPPTRILYRHLWPEPPIYSLDAFGDSYFEYLVKLKVYAPMNTTFPNEFREAFDEIENRLTFTSWKSGLTYVTTALSDQYSHQFSHLSFFLPGTLYLAAQDDPEYREKYIKLADELLDSAIKLHQMQPTFLGGESIQITAKSPGVYWDDDTYNLRPEFVESLFYCWRFTHNETIKKIAWKVFRSIKRYCLTTSGGFSSVHGTTSEIVFYDDIQDSYFLSETLKYLYLIFCDDDVYSLDDYVFTTQAHPLKKLKKW
ncbi:Mannosyl-oligosaccharide 1,2-alpha-mannosidase MNS1 [Tritrichomonas foetus]|uniref:alpha-1,2-Mannosidase n=1 Tax=Tritrichomonas foetus TaxID=1144522 RepID=A0A1J4JGQ4_9EUKA|nr:Mannosyl-oligosaccharide 1,2-alpha-mannosidase MNS1 [Tritrichomonas foetus]|eukprot:OHS98358.1 Mannosyl-oligosaccharide 1,2-alpha-mannosidase MNS1 [Tritrichomonas foetus]